MLSSNCALGWCEFFIYHTPYNQKPVSKKVGLYLYSIGIPLTLLSHRLCYYSAIFVSYARIISLTAMLSLVKNDSFTHGVQDNVSYFVIAMNAILLLGFVGQQIFMIVQVVKKWCIARRDDDLEYPDGIPLASIESESPANITPNMRSPNISKVDEFLLHQKLFESGSKSKQLTQHELRQATALKLPQLNFAEIKISVRKSSIKKNGFTLV